MTTPQQLAILLAFAVPSQEEPQRQQAQLNIEHAQQIQSEQQKIKASTSDKQRCRQQKRAIRSKGKIDVLQQTRKSKHR